MKRTDRLVACINVYREDAAGSDQVAKVREIKGASALICSHLYNEVWPFSNDEFLINPEVEGAFQ
jgi:hypothetical protein